MVFYFALAAQFLIFPANMYLTWRIAKQLRGYRAEDRKLQAMMDKDAEDLMGIEALMRAQTDLVALQLAIRLQTPRAYWYN